MKTFLYTTNPQHRIFDVVDEDLDMKKESKKIVKAMLRKLRKDLDEIELNCDKCNKPYTKEEMECDHCFNCGEQILESF